MKGNKRIKFIIIIFVTINIFLLASAIILSYKRAKKIDLILYDAITSDSFTKYASKGQYDDFIDYKETFSIQGTLEEDSVPSDTIESSIEQFHETFFQRGTKWSDLLSIITSLGGEAPNIFADPENIQSLIFWEKDKPITIGDNMGINLHANGLEGGFTIRYALVPIIGILEGLIEKINELIGELSESGIDTTIATKVSNLITLLISKLENSFIYKGIDLFTYDEVFTADGFLIDLTDGLSSKEKKNILNMTDEEALDFSNSVVISFQLKDRGNEWLNYSTSQYLNSFGGNELFIWNHGLNSLSKNQDKGIRYERIDFEKLNADSRKKQNFIVPDTKLEWSLENKEILETEKLESSWEQFLWATYNNIDYAGYFDEALRSDGLESYSLTDYYYNKDGIEYNFSEKFKTMNSEITNTLWSLGDKETSFSNYVLLCNLYRPYIRTNNIDSFIKEASKMASSGLKPSDLLKPGQI